MFTFEGLDIDLEGNLFMNKQNTWYFQRKEKK